MSSSYLLRAVVLSSTVLVLSAGSASAHEVWDKRIDDAATRFKILSVFGNEAVLDRETGLVWERHIGDREEPWVDFNWYGAVLHCRVRYTGGRGGWRLPSVEEFYSLVDHRYNSPALLPGHPFLNVRAAPHWTATTVVEYPTNALYVTLLTGSVGNTFSKQQDRGYTWCVRGGYGFDGVQ